MFIRALRICDPQYLEAEFDHVHRAFLKLGYPPYFLKQCLRKANRRYYHPNNRNVIPVSNYITIPFSPQLNSAQQVISNVNKNLDNGSNISLAFKYNNTLRTRLVKNRHSMQNSEVGVYCIPCLDCEKYFIDVSGGGLDVCLEEHRRACRLGSQYSAVATHSLDLDHRIGFRQARIIYESNDRNTRRIIEGALISLNDTFINNKSGTKEGIYINSIICERIKLKDYHNVATTLRTAAFPLFSQVSVSSNEGNPHGTGTYGVETRRAPTPPDPPDARAEPQEINRRPVRRSTRILNQTES